MTQFDTAAEERIDLSERDVRALTDYLLVVEEAPGVYDVYGEGGDRYTVDRDTSSCTCPDAQYRGVECKHQRRVAFHVGEREIPEWIDLGAVDELLVSYLGLDDAGVPETRVATDGGEIIVAGDDGEILEDSDEDEEDTEPHRAVPPYDHEPRGFYSDEEYDDNYSCHEGRE
nr:SWIM zinc finger family protein [Halomarina salina]